jgi:hypothetical protein
VNGLPGIEGSKGEPGLPGVKGDTGSVGKAGIPGTPGKMELKENQDYLAEMVAMDNLASQDSKVNLVLHTSKKIINDSKASQHIDLITKQLWMSTIL